MHRLRRVDGSSGDVFVLGSGTIGGQILRQLRRSGMTIVESIRIPWSDGLGRQQVLREALTELSDSTVDLVWAAGIAGFGADDQQVAVELESFSDVIAAFDHAVNDSGTTLPAIHVLSSAGGLFEGRHVASTSDVPEPQRPYGRLKLQQESMVREFGGSMAVHIHRPSSVYTDPRPGRRPGLIGALLENGLSRAPTPIVGALDTLRDYVHAQDIGRHIAHRVIDGGRAVGVSTSFLVNGEPASIHRVIQTVERTVRRRVLIQFRDAWNAADITFSPSVRAPEFRPMGIGEGTAATFVAMEQAGDLF
jgi:nucleoside-diphosphate-sugar epimerase